MNLLEIALLGPTASGKTSLSIDLAKQLNANILSLDSLSIYKEIDIASAKPTLNEREGIPHFGIDCLHVNANFNVTVFFELYKKAKKQSHLDNKNLIIVGGTGFYLKSMIDGMSYKPPIDKSTKDKVKENLKNGYELLCKNDAFYANEIKEADSYRIEKWLEIYFQTGQIPSQFFKENEKKPLINDIDIYEIEIPKETLRERIELRTDIMINDGLIDEVFFLEKKYTREPNAMRSIGIKETLCFLDGQLSKEGLKEKIVTNTARLAKRQRTFNTSQFEKHVQDTPEKLKSIIMDKYL